MKSSRYGPPICGVYAIRNRENGHEYIGSSVHINRRWAEHRTLLNHRRSPHTYLQNAWHKYGPSTFDFVLLEEVNDHAELRAVEQRLLDTLCPAYNASPSAIGITGYRHSAETLERMCAVQKGRTVSAETRALISASLKGRKIPREQAQRAAAGHRGLKRTAETKARMAEARRGITHSEETRRKLSEAKKGKPGNPKAIAAMAASHRGKPMPDHVRKAISTASQGRPGHIWTDDQKQRVSEALKKRALTPEGKAATTARLRARWHKTD